jgi:protein tyrosine/serine phosphatase
MKISLWLVLLCFFAGCSMQPRGVPASEGIGNFGRVNERLFRGAQPDEAGLRNLQRLGVKTIVNLRMADDVWPAEEATARACGMAYFNVPMNGVWAPTDAQVEKVLTLIATSPAPVFVHCQHGADRTGTVIACYRRRHDGWTADRALAEAKIHGMSAWLVGMKSYVTHFRATESK